MTVKIEQVVSARHRSRNIPRLAPQLPRKHKPLPVGFRRTGRDRF